MPYYIEKDNEACKSGWAVTGDTGVVHGCHTTKASAIKQAVAISLSTDEPFAGERAAIDSLEPGDYVSWNVLDPEILAEVEMVDGEMAVVRIYDEEDGIFEPTDKYMIMNVFKLEKIVRPEMVAEEFEPMDEPMPVEEMSYRAVNQDAPAYMRAAARRGLEYYADGQGGDGLVERTIREARDMAEGRVSDDKWIRIAAWIARHLGDLDSPDANPESDNYPSAGVVAHLLWGSGPSKRAAQRTLDYAESVVARIRTEQESERMTEPVIDESRDKWLRAAWKIKARLEGNAEGRSLGGIETRANHVELRAEGDGRTFSGYASVFNEPSLPLPFTEIVKPGAFKRSLQSRNRMMLLWNHDTSNPLASTRNGSLVLTEDAKGLFVTATLPDTTLGRDIAELVRTGVVDAMSFGFSVRKDSWSHDGGTRYLEDVSLSEVSLVSTPAYEQTSGTVSVRSVDGISADALADALLKIESGEELAPDQGALVAEVISKLTKTSEVEEVEGDMVALYKKKLDLIEKGI
jgi:HK97 family phage prohead protease